MAYHFKFTDDVDMAEVEASLVLAFFGAEALHGEAQVRQAEGAMKLVGAVYELHTGRVGFLP